jgi:SWI/SNF-related matrix-associated actin-dependent regulator 1 of chromatin subfamily A
VIVADVSTSEDLLFRAVRALATACDGAAMEDGAGFNKYDTDFGHALAVEPPDRWSLRKRRSAWVMLKKYRKQLQRYGIAYEQIPEPILETPTQTISTMRPQFRRVVLRPTEKLFAIMFPYDANLVTAVKRIPGARFEGSTKAWLIPTVAYSLEKFVEFVHQHKFEFDETVQAKIDELANMVERSAENLEASRAAEADYHVPGLGGELRPFQKAGVAYAVRTERCFIADEMGLGKTVQALATLKATEAFPAVVVCPASLKLNWMREAVKWLPGKAVELWDGKHGWPGRVNIINYDVLGRQLERLKELKPQAVIFDESHFLKSKKAKRTEAAKELAAIARIRLCLTGTPVLNRPAELISQLEILDRLAEFGGYWQFVRRYCEAYRNGFGLDTSGASNLEELNQRMRALCFIRRNKADVLKELPPKQRSIVPVAITNRLEYEKAENEVIEWLKEQAMKDEAFEASLALLSEEERAEKKREHAEDVAERAKNAEQLVRIEALKKLAAKGKMDAVTEWIEDFLESGEKLVLFAHHVDVVHELARRFNADCITGQTPIPDRQKAVDRFQKDPAARVIVLNLQAGGVGLTLTAASNVAFIELGWTPAIHDQAEDRCHRIGQHDQVTAWYLLGEKTIDEEIQALIDQKRVVVNAATEGKVEMQQAGMLTDLVARLKQR